MKKIIKSCLILLILMPIIINAECKDEDLIEWATKANVEFIENMPELEDNLEYAYFFTITPLRKDVKMEVIDVDGGKAEGKFFEYNITLREEYKDKEKFYGVGCYTSEDLEEEKYTINIYGNENSNCKNELLKTITYTVPRYNRYKKTAICEKYPDHELCQTYTNKTKDMSESEFKKELEKYDKKESNDDVTSKLFNIDITYIYYVIIPFVIITIIYFIRKKKIKKKGDE